MSEMSESASDSNKHKLGYVARIDWLRRVTKVDLRVDNQWAMIGADQRALNGCKQTQLTRIASLAIRKLTPHFFL